MVKTPKKPSKKALKKAAAQEAARQHLRSAYGREPIIRGLHEVLPENFPHRRSAGLPGWRVTWSETPLGPFWILYLHDHDLVDLRAEGIFASDADSLMCAEFPVYNEQTVRFYTAPFRDDNGPGHEIFIVGERRKHGPSILSHEISSLDLREFLHVLAPGDLSWRPAGRGELPGDFFHGTQEEAEQALGARRFDRDLLPYLLSRFTYLGMDYDRRFHRDMRPKLVGTWRRGAASIDLRDDGGITIIAEPGTRLGSLADAVTWHFHGNWTIFVLNKKMAGSGLPMVRLGADDMHLQHFEFGEGLRVPLLEIWRRA